MDPTGSWLQKEGAFWMFVTLKDKWIVQGNKT